MKTLLQRPASPHPTRPFSRSAPERRKNETQLHRKQEFIWGVGIECTFLPHLDVDQFAWTQHDRLWREDLSLACRELGIKHMRYAFPWHRLEPEPGKFVWDYSDERVQEFQRLNCQIMLDVMHFGTPQWLPQGVGDPEFPEALERFTEALVKRYRHTISTWCPCNEPSVCALFSGDFGFWPPHSRNWRGFMPVLSRVIQGTARAIRAIRRCAPEATVLLCDAAEHYQSSESSLDAEVTRRNIRRFLAMDLLGGRVDNRHALYNWLTQHGMSELDLDWFHTHPHKPDVLGLDYYPHSDWELELVEDRAWQRRAGKPVGFRAIATQYYERYGLPMMLTETSIDGAGLHRELWLEKNIEEIRLLRQDGIPLLGLIWWPLFDQIDWDGALTHRIGKIHQVGIYKLQRTPSGSLVRVATPLVALFKKVASSRDKRIGPLTVVSHPTRLEVKSELSVGKFLFVNNHNAADGIGDHDSTRDNNSLSVAATQVHPETKASEPASGNGHSRRSSAAEHGIIVFSHLRWGFVWQRPQQFLSRFARHHRVLFVEEPVFNLGENDEPRVTLHSVMPNVHVCCPQFPPSSSRDQDLSRKLRDLVSKAIQDVNSHGDFDEPLLWYYNPMDSAWSLGHFNHCGIVYDCMDELSQFVGAPPSLIHHEERLLKYADIVFAGGHELWQKKKERHGNAHFFGCGVEFDHFAQAQDKTLAIPPDIDFMTRPILGWFGVIDERVDYGLIGELSQARPNWSWAMIGPVVKIDPNLLPHAPNLYWLGQREYRLLPRYCRAFDVCIMPFSLNRATEFINPTKVLEYLATGHPVISTAVRDVVRQYSDVVHIAANGQQFVEIADRLLREPSRERLEIGLAKAKSCSWDRTVNQMRDLIRRSTGTKSRRGRSRPEALTEAELRNCYSGYRPTPGS